MMVSSLSIVHLWEGPRCFGLYMLSHPACLPACLPSCSRYLRLLSLDATQRVVLADALPHRALAGSPPGAAHNRSEGAELPHESRRRVSQCVGSAWRKRGARSGEKREQRAELEKLLLTAQERSSVRSGARRAPSTYTGEQRRGGGGGAQNAEWSTAPSSSRWGGPPGERWEKCVWEGDRDVVFVFLLYFCTFF